MRARRALSAPPTPLFLFFLPEIDILMQVFSYCYGLAKISWVIMDEIQNNIFKKEKPMKIEEK